MKSSTHTEDQLLKYFLLVLVFSIPVWIVGGSKLPIPVNLPVSSLMSFCPMIAALILSYQHGGRNGMNELLKKAFDFNKIKNKIWYLPILLLNPLLFFLSYVIMHFAGLPLPDPNIPWLAAPVFFVAYFITAIGEELGWTGFAIEPLQDRWGALKAGVFLEFIWAIWHFVPDLQLDQTPSWILWHRLGTVALRILIVWIYNNSGKSVFAAVLFHDMNNVSWSLFPNYGSHYDPFLTSSILLVTVGIILRIWGSKYLDRYRYSKEHSAPRADQ